MKKTTVLAVATAVVLAACGGGAADPVGPRFLAYDIEAGTTLTYVADMAMRFTMHADVPGDEAVAAGLADTAMELETTGSVSYAYGPGTGDGGYTVDVTQVPGTIERVMMDVLGERLEFEDPVAINAMVPELPPARYRLVVDDLGNVAGVDAGGAPVALGPLGFATGGMSGSPSASQLLGPAFSPDAVAPGDTWTWERFDAIPGAGDVRTTGTLTYLRDERIDGTDTVVIAFRTETEGFSLDAGALADLAAGGEDLAVDAEELAAMAASGFAIDADAIVVTGTVFFDADAGVVVRQDSTTSLSLSIRTPELMGAGVSQSIEVDLGLRLVDSSGPT